MSTFLGTRFSCALLESQYGTLILGRHDVCLIAALQASKVFTICWGTADNVVPALRGIQQEPAWPSTMDGHHPEDWPDSEPPPDRRCHLIYLQNEDGLIHETISAIRSFYMFMLVSLEWHN